MTTYSFEVIVTDLDLDNLDQMDRLFSETMVLIPADQDGVTSVSVEVETSSGDEAFALFLRHLRNAAPEVKVERIDPDLVNTTEIAVRLGATRETVRTWALRERRADQLFPAHHTICSAQKLWLWPDIHAWAERTGRLPKDEPTPLDAAFVAWFNGQVTPAGRPASPKKGALRRPALPDRPRNLPHLRVSGRGANLSRTVGPRP
jgi:hypothetical protein